MTSTTKADETGGQLWQDVVALRQDRTVAQGLGKGKQVQDTLRKLFHAVEQSPSVVVITDTEGNIEYVNPKFIQVTGYTPQEVLGQNPSILKSGMQDEAFYRELWETISSGQEWRGEFSNRRKDGEIYWEFASISPVCDTTGDITHYVKVAEDITLRKQAEEVLQKHAAELEARNAELDAFAHTVAHDLKNPLALVVGFADALAGTWQDMAPEQIEKYLGIIARNSQKMNNIVEELLILAGVRRQEVKSLPLNMAPIVAAAWDRLASLVEEYGAELQAPDEWPVALGHGPWVEEVWANYLSNAIKYGGDPPRVQAGASVQDGDEVCFWVRDNGRGLESGEMSQLFAPFSQLDQARTEGHGLGLSIVRRIVEKLGGRVGVESDGLPGRGSTFYFTLPGLDR